MSSKSKGSESNARPKNTLSQFDRGPVQILRHFSTLTQPETISLQLLLFALLEVLSSQLTSNEPHKSRPLFQLLLHLLTTSSILPRSMNISAISVGQLDFVKNYVRIVQATIQTALNIIQQPPATPEGPTVTSVLEKEFAKVLLSIPTPPSPSNITIEIPQPDIQLTVPLPLAMNGTVTSNGFDNIVVLRYARDFYELNKLGKGAFGSVFRARNRLDDRVYAIKKIVFKDNTERTRRQAKCALREVRVLALLSHPNIVQYHCAWLELVPCETSVQRPRSATPVVTIEKPSAAEYHYDSVDKLIQFQDEASSAGNNQMEIEEAKSSVKTSSTSQEDDDDDDDDNNSEMSDFDSNSKATPNVRTHRESRSDGGHSSSTCVKVASQHSTTNGSASNKQLIPFDTRNQMVAATAQAKYITSRIVLFIQMQSCDTTLYDWLRRRDQAIIDEISDANKTVSYSLNELGQTECWRIFQQLLSAVQYLHSQSIVHRDIKPRNIFLSYDAKDRSTVHVRLGDFGLATLFDSEVTSDSPSHFKTDKSAGVGTPLYAPPEQLNSRQCVAMPSSDSYSLGIVLFELFSIFGTETERCHLLTDLRMHTEVCDTFKANYPFEASIIEQLVHIDSAERLSVEQILSKYATEVQQRMRRRSVSTKQVIIEQLQEKLSNQERRIEELELQLAKYRA